MAGNREVTVGGGAGADRLSDLPDDILELILSFLPATDAVRTSVLSRRFRGAWAHAPTLNLSDSDDGLLNGRFLGFAREVLARYGSPGIPALHVSIGCDESSSSNHGPTTAAWLCDAMERVTESVSVSVTAAAALDCVTLPRRCRLRASKSVALRLSGVSFHHCPLVLLLPEPGGAGPGAPTLLGGLTELSLSMVRLHQERVRPLGVFLSSCCPRLRKLRLAMVSGGVPAEGGLTLWPLVLRLDLLEELEVDAVETFTRLQVAAPSLRTLAVLSCFNSFLQRDVHTVVEISAPRLEDLSWSGAVPKHLSFLNVNGSSPCIQRLCLSGLRFYLPGKEIRSVSVVRLLEMCSTAQHLTVRVDIPDSTSPPPMLNTGELKHVPHLPNVRVLSLEMFSVLQLTGCPIAPIVSSFLRRCPNLARLHIDLSNLNMFSRLAAECFMFPGNDETGVKKPLQSTDPGTSKRKTRRDQHQLSSLREIRLNGFMGTDREMEVADLLFGVSASRPALERISVSLLPHLNEVLWYAIGAKMKTEFPLVGGCWETVPTKELTWTRT